MKVQKIISQIISVLFHPLLMPTYGFLILIATIFQYFPIEAKLYVFLIIFSGTFVLPIIFFLIFMLTKHIESFQMKIRQERILPLIMTFISFYFTYYIIKSPEIPLPLIFNNYLLVSIFSVILSLIVNLYWKISLHLIGMGGVLGLVMSLAMNFSFNFQFLILVLILISGLVGFSRLYLKSHTSAQVYIGFLSGFSLVFLVMYLF